MTGSGQFGERAFAVVFDLDDTLFPERDYFFSGILAAEQWIVPTHGINGFGEAARAAFLRGRRGHAFDEALDEIAPGRRDELMPGLLAAYRANKPKLVLQPDVRALLERMRPHAFLALASDGRLQGQQDKVDALGLAPLFDHIRLTDSWGRDFWKPHPRACEEVMTLCPLGEPSHYVFVGDNPAKDFHSPVRLGWRSIRVQYFDNRPVPPGGCEAETKAATLAGLQETLRSFGIPF
ncbi:MAG TPA: HAD family hydrolase [Opitutales bacterium]|nr:HAD family hydrolase [Opitutales bacterium]